MLPALRTPLLFRYLMYKAVQAKIRPKKGKIMRILHLLSCLLRPFAYHIILWSHTAWFPARKNGWLCKHCPIQNMCPSIDFCSKIGSIVSKWSRKCSLQWINTQLRNNKTQTAKQIVFNRQWPCPSIGQLNLIFRY